MSHALQPSTLITNTQQTLPYVHLHLHTEYSLLDGANKIKPLAKKVKELGMNAVAMTDHGNLFGAIDFYKTMKSYDIKPIIGIETYLHNGEEVANKSNERFHLCLYAKNQEGYKNLMFLSSIAFIEGFYHKPRISKKILREHSSGLICSSACLAGEVSFHLNVANEKRVARGAKGYERAKEVAREYQDIFGEDFYLELMRHGIPDQEFIDAQMIQLAKEYGIKLIGTNDAHYLTKDDASFQEIAMMIGTATTINDTNRLKHSVCEFYIKSPQEMSRLFADLPECLLNTQEIANKCNLEIDLKDEKSNPPTPPKFKFFKEYATKEGIEVESEAQYFAYKCKEGLEERLKIIPPEKHEAYKERLQREIDIITQMKFPGYMLIVWDFIKHAKSMGIPVGPGRGSAAGSLVAFCLKITNIDPMKYDLLFERFLNPERVSMPDIDTDFCQRRRGEVVEYMTEKYGKYNVAQVITFGKMLAKGVIRDIGRVLEMSIKDADALAKLIPEKLGITLKGYEKEDGTYVDGAWELEPKIRELVESNPLAKKVWENALKMEGFNRNAGKHAAALVVDSEQELWHKTPLYKPSGDDSITTQYSMKYLEPVDLIKFDFLGLKTLTVIDDALKLIKKRHGKDLDFLQIDVDDPNVYKTIQSGDTLGIFQIESSMFQDLNRRLQPSCFEDIIAIIALGRPGPMESGMVDDFINRKHGLAKVTYMFDALEPILKPTYGTIVYQEQVMQIVQTIGGFSLGEADLIRRAMGKKDAKIMADNKAKFASGAEKQGFNKSKAEELWELIVKFAGYGFNKSHSAAYAMITFQTAYLKTYYQTEFMAALLTSEQNNTDNVVSYIEEVKKMGIEVVAPNIQKSALEFSVEQVGDKEVILFGLGAIKGAGKIALNGILNEREAKGEYTSLENFLSRIDPQKVNKKTLESFIKSGALDCFNHTRNSLLTQVEKLTECAKNSANLRELAKNSLFADDSELLKVTLELDSLPEFPQKQILEMERESIGFYISGHPLEAFRKDFEDITYNHIRDITNFLDGDSILLVAKVEDTTTKISKKGNRFGVIKLLDFSGSMELTVFEKHLEQLANMNTEAPIAFKCTIEADGESKRARLEKILTLQEAKKEKPKVSQPIIKKEDTTQPLLLRLSQEVNADTLETLLQIVQKNPGERHLQLVIRKDNKDLVFFTKFKVNTEIQSQLTHLQLA